MTGTIVPLWDLGIVSLFGVIAGIWAIVALIVIHVSSLLFGVGVGSFYGIPTFRIRHSYNLESDRYAMDAAEVFFLSVNRHLRIARFHRLQSDRSQLQWALNRVTGSC